MEDNTLPGRQNAHIKNTIVHFHAIPVIHTKYRNLRQVEAPRIRYRYRILLCLDIASEI